MPDSYCFMRCPKDLGCFSSCGIVNTGLITPETGLHQIVIFRCGLYASKTLSFNVGDIISLPAGIFNEQAINVFQIVLPSGTVYEFNDSGQVYNTFSIETKIVLNLD